MDFVLTSNLPIEIVDIIAKDIHQRYMYDLIPEIENNVTWVRTKRGEYSFLIGATANNPYFPIFNKVQDCLKNKSAVSKQLRYNYFKENNIYHKYIDGVV